MILKEGVGPVAVGVIVTAATALFAGPLPSLLPAAALAYLAHLFWERRPPVPSEPKAVLAPVRGVVSEVVSDRDPWLDRDVLRIRIRVQAPGIVPLRAPIEGKVMDLYTARGTFDEVQRPCEENESPDCYASWIRTDEDEDVIYAISSRRPVSRARYRNSPGERIGHGKRAGFVYFATEVDILVPAQCQPRVEPGTIAISGVTPLAQLPRS